MTRCRLKSRSRFETAATVDERLSAIRHPKGGRHSELPRSANKRGPPSAGPGLTQSLRVDERRVLEHQPSGEQANGDCYPLMMLLKCSFQFSWPIRRRNARESDLGEEQQ